MNYPDVYIISLLIANFLGNIYAKNYQNRFMCVRVIARQSSNIFETHAQYMCVHNRYATSLIAANYIGLPPIDNSVH